jgi:hypothetical protein
MQEIHFEEGMQRSHLVYTIQVEWFNNRNLRLKTDDFIFLISSLDPPKVDPIGSDIYIECRTFQEGNPWLEKVTMEQREEFLYMVRREVSRNCVTTLTTVLITRQNNFYRSESGFMIRMILVLICIIKTRTRKNIGRRCL